MYSTGQSWVAIAGPITGWYARLISFVEIGQNSQNISLYLIFFGLCDWSFTRSF